jgi:23S rRNA (cytidine1920-2'-O)/16S rRNA (cytidine1409-2'-O)-methyltransferase
LRRRAEIVALEQTDIRKLEPARLKPIPDFAAIDVSFISLKLVLPAVDKLLAPRAQILALIKPQFEAARGDIKKGIVRDAAVHKAVCENIDAFAASLGWRVAGLEPSPILGGDGNREFFIAAERG